MATPPSHWSGQFNIATFSSVPVLTFSYVPVLTSQKKKKTFKINRYRMKVRIRKKPDYIVYSIVDLLIAVCRKG